ncbi:MAG: hypothetical protein QM729_10825 [Solirubrobacterales bacterium]
MGETMNLMRYRRLAGVLSAVVTAVALGVPAAQAATPASGYEQFAGCPSPAEDSGVEICLHSTITGGHFKLGSKNVPITNPITLTGGTNAEFEDFVANSQGGLKPVKEKVPGGVIGLTGLTWLAEFLGSEALTLYAVTEAVGTPELTPENITLPIRVHLVNSALGNSCYVGSAANPITLHLTTGTTDPPSPAEPISGEGPVISFLSGEIILLKGKYVDNTFSAPGATGCTLTLLGFIPISINGLVDSEAGLPAAAGTNETVQEISTEAAEASVVYP